MSNKKDLKRAMGYRLSELRKYFGYTQQKMSAALEISRPYYAKQELGDSFPGYLGLKKLGDHLNVSLDWLVCGKGSMFSREHEKEAVPNLGEVDLQESTKAGLPGNDGKNKELVESSAEGSQLSPAHRQLIKHMKQVPLLHHEVMAFYHRFLLDRPGIADSDMLDSGAIGEP